MAQAAALGAPAACLHHARAASPRISICRAPPRPRRSTSARSSTDRIQTSLAEQAPPPLDFPVTIRYKETVTVPVVLDWHDAGCDLHSYMMLPVDQYVLLDLPLGARDAGSSPPAPRCPRGGGGAGAERRSASVSGSDAGGRGGWVRRHPPRPGGRQRDPLPPHHQQHAGASCSSAGPLSVLPHPAAGACGGLRPRRAPHRAALCDRPTLAPRPPPPRSAVSAAVLLAGCPPRRPVRGAQHPATPRRHRAASRSRFPRRPTLTPRDS